MTTCDNTTSPQTLAHLAARIRSIRRRVRALAAQLEEMGRAVDDMAQLYTDLTGHRTDGER